MVILGPILFSGFEVPERILLGGKQRMAVHELPGGVKVADVLGASDDDITWSGVVSGPAAEERIRLLESMRRGGLSWPLIWDGWRFTVVVKRFQAAVAGPFWAPYRISCFVVEEGDVGGIELLPATITQSDISALTPLTGVALETAITSASAALRGTGLAGVVAAAGQAARLVSARAFAAAIGKLL